jgi:hypothetical protein
VRPRGLLGGHRDERDRHVGGVAGHQPDGGARALDQAPRDRVRLVSEFRGGGHDALGRFRGNAHVAAVEYLAGRLEADTRARGDFLDRGVSPSCHPITAALLSLLERTFAHNAKSGMSDRSR